VEAVGELLPPDGGKVSEAVAEGVSVEAGQAAVVPLVDGDGHPLVEGDHRHPLVDGDALVHDVLRCEALQGLRADVSKPGFKRVPVVVVCVALDGAPFQPL